MNRPGEPTVEELMARIAALQAENRTAAARFPSNRGGRAILLVDGLSALQQRVDYTTLTKPFTGADLLGVINSLIEAAK